MRTLLAAIQSLFLPPRGAHRAAAPPPPSTSLRPAPTYRPAPPCPLLDVIAADGMPLVRPYVVVWERKRDEQERRRRLQRERRRAAVLASLGQDYCPWEAAV
ncbi:hypothetical protein JIX56_19095 [Streptomyces sp. CA-210063]|uniref:hypothetical protein n=1 Tax=Streptomyces sp. CA-210063 TaxID=2801029 RepID=UPI00214B92AB|nr:hypothetical protein [Streptomyces sp. CA-210063]UUU31843.1 hypothetical protein JIX56_19095 [Streptomyces sp. CA-210063]